MNEPRIKKTINVTLYDESRFPRRYDRPEILPEYIAWLQERLTDVPESSRDTCAIDIWASAGDGLRYQISYSREETDAEMNARYDEAESTLARNKANELRELARLLAKYAPVSADATPPKTTRVNSLNWIAQALGGIGSMAHLRAKYADINSGKTACGHALSIFRLAKDRDPLCPTCLEISASQAGENVAG